MFGAGFGGSGGAIAVVGGASASVINSTFSGNLARREGPGDPPRRPGDRRQRRAGRSGQRLDPGRCGPGLRRAAPADPAQLALAGDSSCPGTGQRGPPRPALGACDAGAVEVQPSRRKPWASRNRGREPRRGHSGSRPADQVAPGQGPHRRHRALPPRRRRAGHLHHHQDRAGAAQGHALRQAGRRQPGRQALHPHPAAQGQLRHQGAAGQNALRFTGRLRGKAVPPGRYTLVAMLPRPATGKDALATRAFRIVR